MNIFDQWDMDRTLSTMQRLQEANARMRRQGTIDRIVFWSCLLAVVTVAVLTHKGVI